jgi:anti-sigma B factor antagonist
MQLSERRVGTIVVLDLVGKLTLTDNPGRLKDKITSLIWQGESNIVLNLAQVNYIDSSGLGELVASHTTAWRGGATVKLANSGRRVWDLLVLTKLATIFDCYGSEEAALESFAVAA